jgi:DNA polymerase (family 10)
VELAGDFRRGCELVTNLALVAEVSKLDEVRVIRSGELTLFLTDRGRFGITLLLATGSEAHLDSLRELAKKRGMSLTPDGLMRGSKRLASSSERAIYSALGLSYIPPELREGGGEIGVAKSKKLPPLIQIEDVQGILHAHTSASDGAHSLEAMALAARDRGFSYFGVADHSRAAHYAGGLTLEEIEDQHREVQRLNDCFRNFRIFKGIEADIFPDGALDYSPEILGKFDFVVASIHSKFNLDRASQTKRLLRAIANPQTTILGHMTGRQLLRRKGYEVDIEKVLAACAEHGVAVEINANPWRLDLDWRWYAKGLEMGCIFSVNTDAHSTGELDFLKYGIGLARKGGLTASNVLNCLSARQFAAYLQRRRKRMP